MTSSPNSEDIITQITGNFGKWQLKTLIFICLCKIPATWFMACISFTAPVPQTSEFLCIPAERDVDHHTIRPAEMWLKHQNETTTNTTNELLEKTDREFFIDQCYSYRLADSINLTEYEWKITPNNQSNWFGNSEVVEVPCEQFEHRAEYKSLVTQFDLVCSREMLVSLTQAFHALGGLIGGLIALNILKYISPKRLMMIGIVGQIICGNLTGLVSTFILHVYYRCLTSVFCSFMTTSGQVIVSDITSGKQRTIILVLSEMFASIALILLPGVSMYCDSWTYLYIAISSSLLLFIIPHRFITDSPRWHLKQGHIDETLKILSKAASINCRQIPSDVMPRLEQKSWQMKNSRMPSYWTIWDGKTPRRFIFMLHWNWSVSMVIYTVMILMIRLLGVKYMHVNTFCLGFAEILGIAMGLYIIMYTRKHWLHSGWLLILGGVTTYFIWLSPDGIKESRKAGYELCFWLILKMLNSAVLIVLTTRTAEMVSIEKRPMLMLSTGCFSRFWLTVVPFTLVVGKIHYLLPMTMFATAAISSGIMLCYFNRHFQNADVKPTIVPAKSCTYRKRSSLLFGGK
ncbi:solute carrier family 22 member 3-like [Musca vetustissima]|uniref:solute carrier family 22 member 3-like n=1 Tax=Musca vetustissima TaxID=27455 RepID=UPI002AB784B4|nr:solute carrier family 22 member 3-like [Musca vetustissima]